MSLTVTCPNCGNSLKSSAAHVGRRAKCPRCGGSITIAASDHRPAPAPKQPAPAKRSATDSGPSTSEGRKPAGRPASEAPAKSPQRRKYSRSHIVVTAFVALVAGYVGGSFHPLDEMLGEFAEASRSFTDSYQMPSGGMLRGVIDESSLDEPMHNLGDRILAAPNEFMQALGASMVAIGQDYAADRFTIALTDARFADSDTETTNGEDTPPTGEAHLVCTFLITNTNDQDSFNVHQSKIFDARHFTIVDNAGNHFRDIDFEMTAESATLESEIPPGEQRTYLAHFIFPRLAAGGLILSLDTEAFGGSGRISFMIPEAASGKSPLDGS